MKYAASLVLACALWGVNGFPYRYYGSNMDTLSYASSDYSHGGMALSRFYNPGTLAGSGMAAFMYKPEGQENQHQASQYYLPDRRRQTLEADVPPQQNEVDYSQAPDIPSVTEPTELTDPLPTGLVEIPATVKAVLVPELSEPDLEDEEELKETRDIEPTPKKRVTKKKQAKRPEDEEEEEDEEDDDYIPRMATGAFFPMFFGWGGGRSSGGIPKGATAIANAFSTGRNGAASSHATAYGPPRSQTKIQ